MSLAAGTRLGPYEIAAQIGVGGMGEVYRATDLNLKRAVAIKVLPESVAADADRLARFQREAEILASLNHPNIAHLYGLEKSAGMTALVMELVEGSTLADRIAQGPIPLEEALPLAKQIAEALEAAHDQAIIHRDLKPANIKVRRDGTVKVLDFGLAKAFEPAGAIDASQSPTITSPAMTRLGVILGTAAYMSPEQARGKPVDKRTDIWAFGCVLSEMLTGRAAFAGDTVSDTIAAVLEREPDWSAAPDGTPAAVRRLVARCLEKDPKRRLHDIADARIEMEDALAVPAGSGVATMTSTRRASSRAATWALATALALGGVVVSTVTYLRGPAPPAEPLRFTLVPPAGVVFGERAADRVPSFAISPNGRQLVFVATAQSGQRALWVQTLGSLTAGPLVGTEGVGSEAFPFWSPDSTHVAFFAAGKLKKVHVSGGATITLADAPMGQGGTWNREGVILFAPDLRSVLFRVSDAGGTPTPVTTIHQELGHQGHVFPQFLPDGRQFLYLVRGSQPQGGIYLASLDREETKLLLPTSLKAMYAPPGYLLFLRDARLMALAFDLRARATLGEPVAVAESVAFSSTNGRAAYTVSDNGVLAFRTAGILATSQMVWTDRLGKTVASVGPPGDYVTPNFSPDESRLAVESHDLYTGSGDLWVFDLRRGTSTRYTTDGSHNNSPVWSPNGATIVYASREGAVVNLHLKSTSGSEPAEALLPPGPDRVPSDWSPDGQHILYQENDARTRFNLRVLRMPGREPLPYLETPFAERDGHFSPDGRWVAYVSDESGADEVYVRPFPLSSGKWPISNGGGQMPRWRADGKELFYRAGNTIMVAPVRTGPPFDVGRPQAVFTGSFKEYSVSRNGRQFLLNPETPVTPVAVAPPISLVLNWMEELKQRVPVK